METVMDFESIKKLPYPLLINRLPKIVSSFSTSTRISKNFNRGWNRVHRKKIIRTVSMPKEIELYIVNEIKDVNKYFDSTMNIVNLIKTSWYISFKPFEDAIIALLGDIMKSPKKIKSNAVIFVDNLMRKNERPFDVFFINDLIWLLGTYFYSIVDKSKIITYRNKNMESNYPQSESFPFKEIFKKINEVEIRESTHTNFLDNIRDCRDNDYVIYITKILKKDRFDRFYSEYNKFNQIKLTDDKKRKRPSVIIWGLQPLDTINQEEYEVKFLQGFTEQNFMKIESILNR